jgi:hypothetical protein
MNATMTPKRRSEIIIKSLLLEWRKTDESRGEETGKKWEKKKKKERKKRRRT